MTYAMVLGALAIAGWIWALTNADMPDALWLLTVAVTIVAIACAVYSVFRRSRGAV